MLQITLLVIAGLIGTLVRQLPASSLRDPAAYAAEMAQMHQRYDALDLFGLDDDLVEGFTFRHVSVAS